MEIKVEKNNIRLDQYLASNLDYTRSKIEKLIKEKNILVNNKETKKSYMLKENDVISIKEIKEEVMNVMPEKMDLNIVYEDDDVIVVNKANGVVVHPAVGNFNHTLVNGLMYHSKLSSINGEFRPGIVHRIDAYTTGLLMVAKNDKAHLALAKQLEEKTTHRKYVALVWGVINTDTGTIDAPIGRDLNNRQKYTVTDINSKDSITHFKTLKRYKEATLIECKLDTGRTHQIRVHMEYIGHPVVNDPVYGRRKIINNFGQMLHSKSIKFTHPVTKELLSFEVEPPKEFIEILEEFQ